MNAPAVSVVVPAYNQCQYLAEAIATALAQTMRNLEVIVVDDGSTDATPELCSRIDDPRLRYVRQVNDGTKGVGARNHAMLLARGEWIAPLDQDDRWAPEKLERQLATAAGRDAIGAVFCRVRFIDAHGQPVGEQEGPLPQGEVFHLLLSANRYYVSSGMFRRALLPRMGIPHESVGIGDWYLWASVSRHCKVAAVQEVLVDYRVHDEGFQVAQRAAGAYGFWLDHWKFVQAVSVRAHEGCSECAQAMHQLRRLIADQQFDNARAALRRGDFSGAAADALRCAWAAEPGRYGQPRRTFRAVSLLARAVVSGLWARKRRR